MENRLNDEQQLPADNDILDRMNLMKIELIQNMNHNFKTPLAIISSSLHIIRDMISFDDIDEDEIISVLDAAQSEIIRLAEMLSGNTKDISLLVSKQSMEVIDTSRFFRETLDAYHVMLERKFNTLIVEIPQSLPPVYGSKELLSQAMANLISNANRYTGGGVISVTAEEKSDSISIKVSDNGCGVAPELLPRIFERGVSDGGSGLGLYICKMIIEELHNGEISVESTESGTSFFITLPKC